MIVFSSKEDHCIDFFIRLPPPPLPHLSAFVCFVHLGLPTTSLSDAPCRCFRFDHISIERS